MERSLTSIQSLNPTINESSYLIEGPVKPRGSRGFPWILVIIISLALLAILGVLIFVFIKPGDEEVENGGEEEN